MMKFVADVTVGEGEAIPPNTPFLKTWKIENSGKILCVCNLFLLNLLFFFLSIFR